MAGENTFSTLDSNFKIVYADKIEDLRPDPYFLPEMFPFQTKDRQGKRYEQPVQLTREQGVTRNGGATVGSAFTLNAAVNHNMDTAEIDGSEVVIQSAISYGAASRAEAGGKAAFVSATEHVVMNMTETMAYERELQMLYGQSSIGAVGERVSGAGTTTQVYGITDASWAPGIWAGQENAYLDAYDVEALTTKHNGGTLQITAIDLELKRITLVGAGGTTAGEMDNIIVGSVLVPRGWKTNSFAGINKILTNTGTLFGISASTYALWKSTSHSATGGALTMAKLQNGVVKAVGRGLAEDAVVLCSVYSWNDLNSDLAALRRFGESTKTQADLGTQSIKYYGLSGALEIRPHTMVKAGEAFVLPKKRVKRFGSTDITFNLNGNDKFFRELEAQAGFALRAYFDQCLFIQTPARCVKVTSIVNTSTVG